MSTQPHLSDDEIRDEVNAIVYGHAPGRVGLLTALIFRIKTQQIVLLAERGMVVLGSDGEPLDVRPVLRALATWSATDASRTYLKVRYGVTGPLADACLAAAEVEP